VLELIGIIIIINKTNYTDLYLALYVIEILLNYLSFCLFLFTLSCTSTCTLARH